MGEGQVFVVLYGCASKPDVGDEIKGYALSAHSAKAYCDVRNQMADKGWSYWYETVDKLPN